MSPIIDMNDVVTFLSFSFRADVVFGFLFRELLLFLVVSKLQWPENDLSLDYGQKVFKNQWKSSDGKQLAQNCFLFIIAF